MNYLRTKLRKKVFVSVNRDKFFCRNGTLGLRKREKGERNSYFTSVKNKSETCLEQRIFVANRCSHASIREQKHLLIKKKRRVYGRKDSYSTNE